MKTQNTNSKHLNIVGNGGSLVDREAVARLFRSWRQKLGCFSILTALPTLLASHAQAVEPNDANEPLIPAAIGTSEKPIAGANNRFRRSELLRRQGSYLLPHQQRDLNIVDAFTGGSENRPGLTIPSGTYTSAAPFNDTGDTTGANNTVNRLEGYYYFNNVSGPDLVYTFTLTSRGESPAIVVTPSSDTYDPAIYILDSRWGGGCPSQSVDIASNWWKFVNAHAPGGSEVISSEAMRDLPLNVPLYLFIDSNGTGVGSSGSYTLKMQDVSIAPGPRRKFDFNADSKADTAVFRPSDNAWYSPSEGFQSTQFGISTDILTPADFDGDGKTDISIFRDGTWWRINSSDNTVAVTQFGLPGDIAVPADYTGDGRAEVAVYREGSWWTLNLANGQVKGLQFGIATDKPVPADYDGDGKTDYAIYRNGEWHLYRSTEGYTMIRYGLAGDTPVPANYASGDRALPAVFRNGVWYYLYPWGESFAFQFGIASDIPVPADYDGDGDAEAAVYRNGVWYIRKDTGNMDVRQFGRAGDKPIPAAYLP